MKLENDSRVATIVLVNIPRKTIKFISFSYSHFTSYAEFTHFLTLHKKSNHKII